VRLPGYAGYDAGLGQDSDVAVDATFWTDGCGTSVVCASMVTIMANGRTLEQAARIDQQSVLGELGGLPEEDRHCALLAANTLREATGCTRSEPVRKVKDNADV
jgi:NifU-like protein involved in Fe-S cluster formation